MTQILIFDSALLTVSKAAAALRASRQTVYRWIKTGKLQSIKIGGCFFVPFSDVERFDNNRRSRLTKEGRK